MRLFYVFLLILLFVSCENKELDTDSYLKKIPSDEYYPKDIIPAAYSNIYGFWRISSVFGGIAAIEHEPEFDYLELKRNGIYGIIKNNRLTDYGKIEVDTDFENDDSELVIKFVSFSPAEYEFGMIVNPKIVNLDKAGSLELLSTISDGFNYYFVKAD